MKINSTPNSICLHKTVTSKMNLIIQRKIKSKSIWLDEKLMKSSQKTSKKKKVIYWYLENFFFSGCHSWHSPCYFFDALKRKSNLLCLSEPTPNLNKISLLDILHTSFFLMQVWFWYHHFWLYRHFHIWNTVWNIMPLLPNTVYKKRYVITIIYIYIVCLS